MKNYESRHKLVMRVALWASVLLFLLVTVIAAYGIANAETREKTLEFSWEQPDLNGVGGWFIYWADSSGGPYTNITDENDDPIQIVYDPEADAELTRYSTDQTLFVTGSPGTTVTKYFVITAYRDTDPTDESAYSNEVSWDFEIPVAAPFKFQMDVVVSAE